MHLYRLPVDQEGEATDAPASSTTIINVGAATAVPSPAHPSPGFDTPAWSLNVNAMNFCRMGVFALSPLSRSGCAAEPTGKGKSRAASQDAAADAHGALIAVPSLTKDDYVNP